MSTPRPNYGITRIDQEDKKNHGYYVRITHKGKRYQKYFPDKSNGGKSKALRAAKEYRDDILAKLPKYKQEAASRKKRQIKKSGITGVTHVVSKSVKGKNYDYWQAAWVDTTNKRKTAKFSIARYGEEKALSLAKKARKEGLNGRR
ncbi:MAG: AP2 domain-containing protein [Verrucomicrobiales bacterium]|nr:AP2 domain-containing protein [Verrucomicrobiales bacterium]